MLGREICSLDICSEVKKVSKRIFSALVFLVIVAFSLTALAATRVNNIRTGVSRDNVVRFTFDLNQKPGNYSVKLDGKKLKLYLQGELASKVKRSGAIKSSLVKKYNVDVSHGEIELEVPLSRKISDSDYKVFYLRKDSKTGRPDRLVLDVLADASASGGSSGSSSGYSGTYRASGGIKGKRITVDAGHGGSDPGAIGANGTYEKNITLAISKNLESYLKDKGARVTMTRKTDVDVYGPSASDAAELQARVDVGKATTADIFVSIHINASNSRSVSGISTYYDPKTSYDAGLAKNVQDSMMKSFRIEDLGTRQAGFYVIKRSPMPAILCEICFISNPQEEKLLQSKWFQRRVAQAIADGIENYFK